MLRRVVSTRWPLLWGAVAITLVVVGGAGAQPAPRMSTLPPLAVAPARPSTGLRAASAAVRRVMTIRLRRPPARLNMEKFTHWTRTRFSPWVTRRREALTAAEALLGPLARSADPREHVIGGAYTGLLYDDFALQLVGMPRPAPLARDPDLARAYDEAIDGVVAPMLRRAAEAYQFCEGRPGAPDWSAWCTQRLTALRAAGRVPAAPAPE